MQEEIIDPGMDVHTVTTSTSNGSRRSRGRMSAYANSETKTKGIVKIIKSLYGSLNRIDRP